MKTVPLITRTSQVKIQTKHEIAEETCPQVHEIDQVNPVKTQIALVLRLVHGRWFDFQLFGLSIMHSVLHICLIKISSETSYIHNFVLFGD